MGEPVNDDAGVPDPASWLQHHARHANLKITVLWAWVSVHPETGQEGILSHYIPSLGHMPMVGADEQRIESLRPIAELAAATNPDYTVRLIRFTHREEMP